MAQPDAEVRKLLEQRLAALPAAPAIAWENRAFTPPTATPWLRPALIFGSQVGETLFGQGNQGVYDVGRFVVTCYGPQGAGPGAVDALAAAVRSWFKPGTQLVGSTTRVLVESASRGPGLDTGPSDSPAYFVPVTIAFRAWYALQ